jgi:GNAT superfamily N-acetyltransferase
MTVKISRVDYSNHAHREALVTLMNHYASDPAGGGQALSAFVQSHLAQRLSQIPWAFSFLADLDETPVGLVNCFEGFSTFACRSLVNIHDLVVHKDYRGKGVSQALLQSVETEALNRDCCKITLEVLQGNTPAYAAYQKFGFSGYQLDTKMGQAIFLEKRL